MYFAFFLRENFLKCILLYSARKVFSFFLESVLVLIARVYPTLNSCKSFYIVCKYTAIVIIRSIVLLHGPLKINIVNIIS